MYVLTRGGCWVTTLLNNLQHHRKLGFKSELGGRSRAKAGIMQRISMVALRATARQVIRGVALVGAANVQAHSDRRAEKTAEAAKYDAFGPNHGGAFRPFALRPSTAGAPLR